MRPRRLPIFTIPWLAISCAVLPAARGDIVAIEACLEARVSEFVDGEQVSTDTSVELFPETAPQLPLTAFAALADLSDSAMTNINGAAAFAEFNDPTLSTTANPAELGLELECLSSADDRQFDTVAAVVEDREVTFSADELGLGEDETDRLVRSSVFIEGAVLVWSRDPTADLSGLTVNIDWRVLRTDNPTDIGTAGCGFELTSLDGPLGTTGVDFGPDTDVAFAIDLDVTGTPNGGIDVRQSSFLVTEIGDATLLGDEAEIGDLLDGLIAEGTLHLVLLPPQQFDYLYPVLVDQPFTLQSLLRASATNLPDGTAVGAVVGRPFTNLADALAALLADGQALRLQQAINAAVAGGGAADIASPPVDSAPAGLCGLLGAEILGLGLLLPLLGSGRLRRTITKPSPGCR